ncbi:PUB domain protein [Trichinella nativa]|uniref:PUB domain protein n=1 Tax=Trichinella nativa TaxID=6335 RepID=A0A1Y3ECZ4_9BILA|nr:PUB domain protein [Trichinella nativa]
MGDFYLPFEFKALFSSNNADVQTKLLSAMDKIRKLVEKKKAAAKFRKAGPPRRLNQTQSRGARSTSATQSERVEPQSNPQPKSEAEKKLAAEARQKAEEAALKRCIAQQSKDATSRSRRAIVQEVGGFVDHWGKLVNLLLSCICFLQARRQLEFSERVDAVKSNEKNDQPEIVEVAGPLTLCDIFFTCDLLGDDVVLPKEQLIKAVEEHLRDCLEQEPLIASSIMIYSLNSSTRSAEVVAVLKKYLGNLLEKGDEEKYRRIRMANKIFEEKVLPVKGALEFLHAVGFNEVDENNEKYLSIEQSVVADVERLTLAMDCLLSGEAVKLKLHRNRKIYKADVEKPIGVSSVPESFFIRTASEILQEQNNLTEQMEKMLTLRTKSMREKDEKMFNTTYVYTLLKIRFPDDYILEGTFNSSEKFSSVIDFVNSVLSCDWIPYHLRMFSATGASLVDMGEKSINELGLAPAALLFFSWDKEVLEDARRAGRPMFSNCESSDDEDLISNLEELLNQKKKNNKPTFDNKHCDVCKKNARYCCPACQARSCSLECVKKHKQLINCDGLACRTRFVPMQNYSTVNFMQDYNMLMEAAGKADTSFWSVEFIFHFNSNNNNPLSVICDKIPNSLSLLTLLKNLFKPKPNSEFAEQSALLNNYANIINLNDLCCFFKVEQNWWTKDDRYYAVDMNSSLIEILKDKIVVEFPTFHICQSENAYKFPIFDQAMKLAYLRSKVLLRKSDCADLSVGQILQMMRDDERIGESDLKIRNQQSSDDEVEDGELVEREKVQNGRIKRFYPVDQGESGVAGPKKRKLLKSSERRQKKQQMIANLAKRIVEQQNIVDKNENSSTVGFHSNDETVICDNYENVDYRSEGELSSSSTSSEANAEAESQPFVDYFNLGLETNITNFSDHETGLMSSLCSGSLRMLWSCFEEYCSSSTCKMALNEAKEKTLGHWILLRCFHVT